MNLYSLLKNQIDIEQVPFSDRGSRLLVYKEINKSRLYLKLAERLMGLDPTLEAHVHRPPFIRDLELLGPNGNVLDFHIDTSPALLEMSTDVGKFELAFRDATRLAFGLPDNSTCGIRFKIQADCYLYTNSNGESCPIRYVSHMTNGTIIKEQNTPEDGANLVEVLVQSNGNSTLQFHVSDKIINDNEIPLFSVIRSAAQKRWQAWFARVPTVAEQYQQTYAYAWWVMATNLVNPLGYLKFEAMMPTKTKYIGLWLWDSALHTLAYRHIDPELARNQIRIFLEHQLPDGMVPDVVFDEGIVSEINHPIKARVTKPPLLAWAALKIHEEAPSITFLREIYEPLKRWNAWWFEQSKDDLKGLAQYNHPYSSGLDDNPLWDAGMPVVSPDLNTYLYIQMNALEKIARKLGLLSEAVEWAKRSKELVENMINNQWDEKTGLFRAKKNGETIHVKTPFNLYPLWTGRLPNQIQSQLLNNIKNPNSFWGEMMLPTVARDDPNYDSDTMWRGPVWANINYFFIEALKCVGENKLAHQLQASTLEMISSQAGIHEYYNPETGRPPATAAANFGWTAAVFIDLAIQSFTE
jgi:glycogen debranching enzyme